MQSLLDRKPQGRHRTDASTSAQDAHEVLDWLVVGGGIHGCHLAVRLLRSPAHRDLRLRVLDPHPTPLARWRAVTRRVGMEFLRSPVVHHIGTGSMHLSRFAPTRRGVDRTRLFRGRYRRPALHLFNAHADAVTRSVGIPERWIQGTAGGLRRGPGGVWEVEWEGGRLRSHNVVLALGDRDRLHWPEWARSMARRARPGEVVHALDPAARMSAVGAPFGPDLPDVVVGAGMTGAQLALRLAGAGRPVILISRGPLRVARFDTEPGWLGPRYMSDFLREPSLERRRQMIRSARLRGSVTDDVRRSIIAAVRRGVLTHRVGDVLGGAVRQKGLLLTVRTTDRSSGAASALPEIVLAARVILATGADRRRPGGRWMDEVAARESLPVAACGYPVPDAALRWAPGLFVSGALAELVVGPVARNVAGARSAGDRIVSLGRARV